MSNRYCLRGVRSALVRAAVTCVVAGGVALPSLAGGPLNVVNQQPVVYPNGGANITLNLDQGPLGARTNAQAATIVRNATAMWNGVSTSTMRLSIGAPLPSDYTALNYAGIAQNSGDGLNPVIFDTDGSIIDAIYGAGAKASVLGFAGSAYYTSGAASGTFIEGRAVLNGALAISDATLTTVLAHEIGHFFGLGHSQLDATQGLVSANFVLMYPIAYRTLQTLHEDDVAAVTALYPAPSASAAYGQLTGAFTTAAGAPILGANIWAREVSTGKVYSVVSDYLKQGTGYFRLSLPPGTYKLSAESIATSFTGGSGVGPYSATATGASFQAPHPIAPVALGGILPQLIAISAGCAATATFHLDGTGSVAGNCAASPPALPTLLTIATSGSGTGAVAWAPVGNTTHVSLIATPAGGSTFMGWLGACTGTGSCTVDSTIAASVTATFAPDTVPAHLDIDGNGAYDALTDGLLIIRYLFGLTGNALVAGTVGLGPARSTAAELTQQLDNIKPLLDVDGNGQVDALTDGTMIVRYMFGVRGASLIAASAGAGATRTTATAIEAYIQSLLP